MSESSWLMSALTRGSADVLFAKAVVHPVERHGSEIDVIVKPSLPLGLGDNHHAHKGQQLCNRVVGCVVEDCGTQNAQAPECHLSVGEAPIDPVVEADSEGPPCLQVPSTDPSTELRQMNASLADYFLLEAGIPGEDLDLALLATFSSFSSEILDGKPLDNGLQLFDALIAGEDRRPGELAVIWPRLVRFSGLLLPVPVPECLVFPCHGRSG